MAGKQTLLLLPGLLCDEALWAPQIEALADVADCRVADLTRDESVAEMAKRELDGLRTASPSPGYRWAATSRSS